MNLLNRYVVEVGQAPLTTLAKHRLHPLARAYGMNRDLGNMHHGIETTICSIRLNQGQHVWQVQVLMQRVIRWDVITERCGPHGAFV